MLRTSTGSFARAFLISFRISSPPRPGMVISRMTTSHRSFQTRLSASWPLRASPNSADLYSSARICRKPWRTTAWSSAMSILMFAVVDMAVLERNLYQDGRSLSSHACDSDFAAEQPRPFAHAQEADRLRVGDLRLRNAAAIVVDLHQELAAELLQVDGYFGGMGMTNHVRERLLGNAEESGIQVLIQDRFL